MRRWWQGLDQILRGEATKPSALERGTIAVRVGELTAVLIVLAMIYGACMGFYTLFGGGGQSIGQFFATIVKVPALFLLTLAVTLPSLYVSNALMGSRLALSAVVRLLAASMAVTISVLASLGPIVAFFSASTQSYSFMKLLNVLFFAASGAFGLTFLLRTLHRLSLMPQGRSSAAPENLSEADLVDMSQPGPLDRVSDEPPGQHVQLVFRLWVVLFGLVGAQMAWVLRPFLGAPGQPFSWFRPKESNFFEAVWKAILSLFA